MMGLPTTIAICSGGKAASFHMGRMWRAGRRRLQAHACRILNSNNTATKYRQNLQIINIDSAICQVFFR